MSATIASGASKPNGAVLPMFSLRMLVALGLQPLSLEQDRAPDVVADVLQLAALSDLAHPAILTGQCLRWLEDGGRCDVAQGRPADPRSSRGARPRPAAPASSGSSTRYAASASTDACAEKDAWVSRGAARVGLLRPGGPGRRRAGRATPSTPPRRSCPGAAAFPTAPVSADAVLLTTVHVDPAHRGGGLGRMLVQGMARDLVQRGGIGAIEAFGDPTRPRRALPAAGGVPRQRRLQDPPAAPDGAAAADGPARRDQLEGRGRVRARSAWSARCARNQHEARRRKRRGPREHRLSECCRRAGQAMNSASSSRSLAFGRAPTMLFTTSPPW